MYRAKYVTLQVRVSNLVAQRLYREFLGFEVSKREAKYYADGEDAHTMRKDLSSLVHDAAADAEAGDAADTRTTEPKAGKADEAATAAGDAEDKDHARLSVKVGRALGISNLVERDERAG